MCASDLSDFRHRQALSDLRHQTRSLPAVGIRRIGAGIGLRSADGVNLQKRLEWYFNGKAPVTNLRRDRVVYGAMLMASALPDDDFEPFVAATVFLLLERLSAPGSTDDGFWNWNRLAPHYRLAPATTRAAIMNGFRECSRQGRITLEGGPSAEDCLTAPRASVLADLARAPQHPLLGALHDAVHADADAVQAGALWAEIHRDVANLPDAQRRAAENAVRHLYERPASIEPPPGRDVAVLPVHD